MAANLRMVSWILLSLVGALTLMGSLQSMGVAYFEDDDQIGSVALHDLADREPEVVTALKARRATAAAFGAGYALLFMIITLLPYRSGAVWAWWSLLTTTVVVNGVILMRRPLLETNLGLGAATVPMAVSILALLLDVRRVTASRVRDI